MMLMLAVPGQDKVKSDAPTDADICVLPRNVSNMPLVFEQYRDDITIVKNQIGKLRIVSPGRF